MNDKQKQYLNQLSSEVFEANLRRYLFRSVVEYSPEFDATSGNQTEGTIYYINLCDRLVSSKLNFGGELFEDLLMLSEMIFECYAEEFSDLECNYDVDFSLFVNVVSRMGDYIVENGPKL